MDVSVGFGLETRAIGVRSDEARAAFGDCFSAKLKRNNG